MNRIKEFRLAKGFKQKDLARITQLSTSAISLFESGQSTPSMSSAFKISKALDTTIEELFPLESSYQEGGVENVPTTSR